jgi:hypothetical protein
MYINLYTSMHHHWFMGRRATIEIVISDVGVEMIKKYGINIVEIGTGAIFEAIRAAWEAERALEIANNEKLRYENRVLQEQLLETQEAALLHVLCKV